MMNVLRRLILVAKEKSTDEGRVEGSRSSSKRAKHCVITDVLRGLALVAKEQSTDDERVEGPSSSRTRAKHL